MVWNAFCHIRAVCTWVDVYYLSETKKYLQLKETRNTEMYSQNNVAVVVYSWPQLSFAGQYECPWFPSILLQKLLFEPMDGNYTITVPVTQREKLFGTLYECKHEMAALYPAGFLPSPFLTEICEHFRQKSREEKIYSYTLRSSFALFFFFSVYRYLIGLKFSTFRCACAMQSIAI